MPIFSVKTLLSSTCLGALLVAGVSSLALANPQDGVVTAGNASITTSGTNLDIHQSTDRAIIDWRSFNIGQGETTTFHQPGSRSVTLNRVNASSPSFIDGTLKANGNIFIVNQSGVLFGSNSHVDVSGLVATSSDINNDKFIAGDFRFDRPGKSDATVENQGQITAGEAGLVGLVAPNVKNSGTITARMGRVQLASGDQATIDLYGDGLIQLGVSDEVSSQLAENTGRIQADGGTITLTAAAGSQIVNSLITSSGELRAPSVGVHNGRILISAAGSNAVAGNINKGKKSGSSTVLVSGALDVSGRKTGERGGKLTVTGDNVALLAGTYIDASGYQGLSSTTLGGSISDERIDAAGGDIQIGGDYLGQGSTPTALNLYVDQNVLVLNDSLYEGDAGRTIFWSDNNTSFYGNVYARALGGLGINPLTWNALSNQSLTPDQQRSGMGGFVETSGHTHLDAGGYVDLTSSSGNRGTYFLDPTNITIYGNVDPTFVSTDGSINLTSGLRYWLDGTDLTTIYDADGDNAATGTGGANNGFSGVIASWRDKASGLLATSTDNAALTTLGGLSGVRLTNDNFAEIDQLGGSATNFNMFSVSRENVASTNFGISFNGTDTSSASRFSAHLPWNDGNIYFDPGSCCGTDRATTAGPGIGVPMIFNGWKDAVAGRNGFQVNGNQLSAVSPGITVANTGGGLNLGLGATDHTIGEVIAYNRKLSVNETALMEQYQSVKFGIALTPPGTGATEIAKATAADGYSAFSARYLERLSQSANVSLQASNNIDLDLKGDTLNFTTAGRSLTLTAGNQITTSSAGTITTNNGAISLTGTNGIAFNHNFSLNSNGGAIGINSPTAIGAGATLTLNDGGSNNTIASAISGNGSLTKAGAGTLTLSGANTYAGATTVNAGVINLSGSLVNTPTLTIASGAAVNLTGTAAYNKIRFAGATWTIDGALNNQMTTGTVAQTFAPTIYLNGGAISGMGVTADVWGDFANSQSSTINATGASSISGIVRGQTQLTINTPSLTDTVNITGILGNQLSSGMLGLTKSGNGTVTLSGINTYTGPTNINAGTLTLTGGWNVGAGTATTSVASGALFNGTGVITAGIFDDNGLGTVSLTGNNLITALTTSGTIGDFTLNNAQSFTSGAITTAAGKSVTLSASGAGNSITTTGAIATGAAGNISLTADDLALGGNLSGTGTLTLQPSSTNRIIRLNTGGADFNLSSAELALLTDGWSLINIGNLAGSNDMFAGNLSFSDPVVFRNAFRRTFNNLIATGNGSFSIAGGGWTDLYGNVLTAGGAFDLSNGGIGYLYTGGTNQSIVTNGGNISLHQINLTTSGITMNAGTGTVSVASTSDGGNDITATGSTITLGALGGVTPVGNVTLTAVNSLTLPAITTSAGKTVDVTVTGAGNALTTTGAIATGTNGNISLTADQMALGGALSGTGTLTLQTHSTTRHFFINYGVDDGSILHLDTTELSYLTDGWNLINIGRTDTVFNNYLIMGNTVWNDSVNFRMWDDVVRGTFLATTGVDVTMSGSLGSELHDAVTLQGGNLVVNGSYFAMFGTTHSITTNGGDVSFANAVLYGDVLSTGLDITTSGGDINVGSINSAYQPGIDYNFDAGSGDISFNGTANTAANLNATGNSISFNGAWGGGTALGDVNLTSVNSIALPTINASSVFVQTTGASSDITLGAGRTITASGAGTAVTLASGRNFINGALTPFNLSGGGRFLIYSADPALNTLTGLTSNFDRYSCTYGGSCSAIPGTGNGFLYSTAAAIPVPPAPPGSPPTPQPLPSTFEFISQNPVLSMTPGPLDFSTRSVVFLIGDDTGSEGQGKKSEDDELGTIVSENSSVISSNEVVIRVSKPLADSLKMPVPKTWN